jgi:ABC-type sugar transport system substrate-binding protein
MKKILCLTLMVLVMGTLLLGCSSTGQPDASASEQPEASENTGTSESAEVSENTGASEEAPAADAGITIGWSPYWLSEFMTLMSEGVEKRAEELGVTLIVADANNDTNKQIGQVENFIAQDVDSMIVAPVDVEAIKPAVDAAKDAGIPFVAANMYVESDNVTAYAGPNDIQAGELAMQYAVDALSGQGNVIILEGADGYSASADRHDGIHNILDKNPNINVLEEKTAEWSREQATSMMENYIQVYGEKINAVVCHNDEMAMGAIQALESADMTGKVIVTAVDAIKDACVAISEGKMSATVYQDARAEGALAVDLAVKLAKGETVEKDNLIEMIVVDKNNIEEYLAMYE